MWVLSPSPEPLSLLSALVMTPRCPECGSVALRKRNQRTSPWSNLTENKPRSEFRSCLSVVRAWIYACLKAVLWICLSFMYVSKGFALSFMDQHIQHHMEKKMRDILQFYTGLNITDFIWPRNTKKSNHSLNNNYAVSSIYGRHLLYMVAHVLAQIKSLP